MRRIAIFFDTNILESRFSEKKQDFLFHYKITANELFYKTINFIRKYNIEQLTDLCVCTISSREIKKHLVENYRDRLKDFKQQESLYKKSFGPSFEITYKFKQETEEQYNEYIEKMLDDFYKEHNCTLIDYPHDIDFFNLLINKCMDGSGMFKTATSHGKTYTDAGFKDAIIFETIIRYCKENDCLTILISKDYDFNNADDIYVCHSIEDLEKFLFDQSYVNNENGVRYKIQDDEYLQETIISMTGNKFDTSVTLFEVQSVSKDTENENCYNVNIKSVINETIYLIDCIYDSNSNSVESVSNKIMNE